jgi:hypothetical protein
VGSIERRIQQLEERIEPVGSEAEDEARAIRRALMRATIDEIARLKSSRARHMRGGKHLESEDIPGQYLTKPYTAGQLIDLAIRLVWEREQLDEELMQTWAQTFKDFCARAGSDLEKVEDYGF